MNPLNRSLLSIVMAALLVSPASFGFQSPLSDESIREAYFLGQRHDASFLTDYIKFFPLPKTGPHISSVTFLTPPSSLSSPASTPVTTAPSRPSSITAARKSPSRLPSRSI
jgi:hypothetical protein